MMYPVGTRVFMQHDTGFWGEGIVVGVIPNHPELRTVYFDGNGTNDGAAKQTTSVHVNNLVVTEDPEELLFKLCKRMQRITNLEPVGLTDLMKIIQNDENLRILAIKFLTQK